MKYFIFSLSILFGTSLYGQNHKAYYIGHSLTYDIPDMVESLSIDYQATTFDWVQQNIPGSSLAYHWSRKAANDDNVNPTHNYGFFNTQGGLPVEDFDVLILNESVPRSFDNINETYEYADSFYVYANQYNPDIKVYIYEVWHCINSGTPTACPYDVDSNPWRQRIDDDLPMWESVVDTLNARFSPTNQACLIPAAQGLAAIYDSISAGVMPGLNDISDLFTDDIHLTQEAKYFIACVHFATIFGVSPVGLTNQLQNQWGGNYSAPSPALAAKFQEIAWNTVITYPHSCISKPTAVNNHMTNAQFHMQVLPNPFDTNCIIEWDSEIKGHTTLEIFNILGERVDILLDEDKAAGHHSYHYETSSLRKGIYFYRLEVDRHNFTMKMIKSN